MDIVFLGKKIAPQNPYFIFYGEKKRTLRSKQEKRKPDIKIQFWSCLDTNCDFVNESSSITKSKEKNLEEKKHIIQGKKKKPNNQKQVTCDMKTNLQSQKKKKKGVK